MTFLAVITALLAGTPGQVRAAPQAPPPAGMTGPGATPTLEPAPEHDVTVPTPPREMTLADALHYARANQPTLLAARARRAAAEQDTRIPGALYEPRLAITAQAFEGTTNNSTASFVAAPGLNLPRIGATPANTTVWSPDPSTIAALGLQQEVIDFGRIGALKALVNAQLDAERGRTDLAQLDLDLAVEISYFGVQTAKRVLDAAQAAYQRTKTARDAAQAGVRAGLRPPVDFTRAEADLSRADVARLDAAGNVVAAQAAFAAVVGVPERTLDAVGRVNETPPAPSLDQAVSDALARDPLVRERLANLEAQRATTRVIASELRPDLSLTATLSGRAGGATPTSGAIPDGNGWVPEVPNWDVGLVFSWPLFDGAVRARERSSRARETARALEIEEAKQAITGQVEAVYVQYDAARQAMPALQQALVAAQANYAQAAKRFEAGLGTALDLADAQGLLAQAEVNIAVGRFRLATARARVGRAIAENL